MYRISTSAQSSGSQGAEIQTMILMLRLEEQQEGRKNMNRNRMNLKVFETDVNLIDRSGAESLIPEERARESFRES